MEICDSPLARSPEVSHGSALCMPNILCFKNNKSKQDNLEPRISNISYKKSSISVHSNTSTASATSDSSQKCPSYLIAVHRKCVRQETYFLSQQKSKPSLFGLPLLLGFNEKSSCQSLYEGVWSQVTRLLSPLPQSDQPNHATDCDDSLGYEFPFTLKAVLQGGQICAICHWTQFCRGCTIPLSEELVVNLCRSSLNIGMCISIDWDPTALHLRYQTSREKLWLEHESVATCRKLHAEPIDLDYCMRAFTSEERLEEKYHCSSCQNRQPATKKMQIWRLPPILIIHLKRFVFVNNKWVKTQKVVNFPFKNFDPTSYLASVPQETILRHKQLLEKKTEEIEKSGDTQPERILEENEDSAGERDSKCNVEDKCKGECTKNDNAPLESCKLLVDNDKGSSPKGNKVGERTTKIRARLESTSLLKTPIIDEHLKDYHNHQLLLGQDPFDLKYQLYAAVCHSGLLNGGHYISYACNPNGHWYCYNDSSCREVLPDPEVNTNKSTLSLNSRTSSCTPLTKRKNQRKLSSESTTSVDLEKKEKDINSGSTETLNSSRSNSVSSVDKLGTNLDNINEKLLKESPYSSRKSLNNFNCPYRDVKVPKIDTSTAYILFYERSGLDYQPYLPKVIPNGKQVPIEDLDENESDLRKQMCAIQ